MTEEARRLEQEIAQQRQQLQTLIERQQRYQASPEYKDQRIRELEAEVTALKKELEPYRKKKIQKEIDDYGNMKCTGKYGCYCPICNDL
jgi:hypothetical protein